jgi:hypothetical protein
MGEDLLAADALGDPRRSIAKTLVGDDRLASLAGRPRLEGEAPDADAPE